MIDRSDGEVRGLPTPRMGTAARPRLVRVAVLDTQTDPRSCCPMCGLPLSVIVYAVLFAGALPTGLCRLTYCDSCEPV